jgi:hypothetical protein
MGVEEYPPSAARGCMTRQESASGTGDGRRGNPWQGDGRLKVGGMSSEHPDESGRDKIKSRRSLEDVPARSAQILLRGDARYNPRFTQQPEIRSDGATRITGLMKPDSPEGVVVIPAQPNIPFRYIIPADADAADYHRINVETWRRLQSGEPLWDLDFAPPPPPQSAVISGGAVLLGALSLGALVGLAFSSRS